MSIFNGFNFKGTLPFIQLDTEAEVFAGQKGSDAVGATRKDD